MPRSCAAKSDLSKSCTAIKELCREEESLWIVVVLCCRSYQYPINTLKCSMCGICTYIYNKFKPNVGKCTAYGKYSKHKASGISNPWLPTWNATEMLLDYEIASTTLGHHWDTDFWNHWDREITEILTYTPSFLYLKLTYTMTKITYQFYIINWWSLVNTWHLIVSWGSSDA